MNRVAVKLQKVFEALDRRIVELNAERAEFGGIRIPRVEVKILGQMSLLLNESVSALIELAETGDLDAFLTAEFAVIRELRKLLKDEGLVYDDLSSEIWLPPNSRFEPLFDLDNVLVTRVDAESALISKAIKAREKNRILIQEAIASEVFPNLVSGIEKNGGSLSYFLEEEA